MLHGSSLLIPPSFSQTKKARELLLETKPDINTVSNVKQGPNMSESRNDCSIILEANANDVLLGRGNAVNFREGNVRFRKLAQSRALRYATCSNKLEKDKIAESILKEIRSMGGRFLRPISAKNEKGEHLSAWELVEEEVALTKAKQTLRDCAAAIRRETAMRSSSTTPPSFQPSMVLPGMTQRQSPDHSTSSFLQHSLPAIQDPAASIRAHGVDSVSSRPSFPMALLGGGSEANRQPYVHSNQLLDDHQNRLLQLLRHQQQQLGEPISLSGIGSRNMNGHATSSVFGPRDGRSQDASVDTAMNDVRRARELMLIEQYQREQSIADAQQRIIWSQLSSQARARYEAAFAQTSMQGGGSDFSLRQLIEAQNIQKLQGFEAARLARSEFNLQLPQDMLARLGQNHVGQATGQEKIVERKASVDSSETSEEGSSDHSSQSTRPLKKRKASPKHDDR